MTGLLHRAPLLGVTALAVLLAVPVARADDAPVTVAQPQSMNDLVRMSAADLQALFAASPPASVPNGFVPGRAIKNPGSRRTVSNSRFTGIAWKGKEFRNDGTMINRLFGGLKAIPADVYVSESLTDGQPALILDYSRSKLWPDVRDEVREVSPGLYLGIMYKNGRHMNPPMFFTLDARK